jgi:hypothetical protein
LKDGRRDKELKEKFESLVSFLKSSELVKLRNEAEKYLAEGNKVKLIIHSNKRQPKYEIKLR